MTVTALQTTIGHLTTMEQQQLAQLVVVRVILLYYFYVIQNNNLYGSKIKQFASMKTTTDFTD